MPISGLVAAAFGSGFDSLGFLTLLPLEPSIPNLLGGELEPRVSKRSSLE